MTSKRLHLLLLALLALLALGLFGGTYGANKLLQQQAAQIVHNRQQIAVLAQEQAQLTKAKHDIAKYQDLSNIAKSVVPQDKDQAQTVRQIVQLANQNGIQLGSISFPNSSLGTKNSDQSQLAPVKDISGVYALQITIQSDPNTPTPYTSFINFLAALEHNRRTALVDSITLSPNGKDRTTLSFNLVLDEYIKP